MDKLLISEVKLEDNHIEDISYYNWNIYKLEKAIKGYGYLLEQCDEDYGWNNYVLGEIKDRKFIEKLYFEPLRFDEKCLDLSTLTEESYQ